MKIDFTKCIFAKSKFIAVGYGGIAYSKDGIKWSKVVGLKYSQLQSVAYGNNTFLAVGNDGLILYSLDGMKWSVDNIVKGMFNDVI